MTDSSRAMLNMVPQVTAAFWIIKGLATTVGETFADFLNVGAVQAGSLTEVQTMTASPHLES